MRKTIEWVVKILIYTTFIVPLIVLPASYIFPFIVPKIVFFRSLVMLMLGGYILLLIINWQEYKPKFTALNIFLTLFLFSFAASTFVGTDAYHSFWDNHERMLGLFTIFHYIAYYFICSAVFKNWNDWKWAMRLFLFAGSIVMFVGVLQRLVDPDLLLNQGSDRVASTLGNAIYVGGYGLFLTFMAYLLAVREKNEIWRWVEVVLGFLGVLGLFYSGTRGSMLGLLTGMAVTILGYIIVLKDYPKTRKVLLGLAALGVVAVSLLVVFRKTNFVTSLPAVGRTVNTSFADVKSSPRWVAWQIAIEAWQEKPIFGWGPNNYFYAFNKYYQAKSLEFGYGETWFDNAHNIIVNTLAVQGTFGIIVYLGMFVTGGYVLWRAKKRNNLNYHVVVIGTAFLVAHLVGNVTVFENPTSYLYFMFWLAMINSLSLPESPDKIIASDKKIGWGGLVATGVVVLIFIYIFNVQPAKANKMTLTAIRELSQAPTSAYGSVETALNFASPHIDDIRSDLGRTLAQNLASNWQKLGAEKSQKLFDLVYTNLQKNLELHPLDIRTHLTLAQLAQIGFNNSTTMAGNKYLLEAELFLNDALKCSPKRQQVIYILSGIKAQIGKSSEGVKLLEQALADDDKISENYWRLAYAYRVAGQLDKAKEVIALAEKNGINFTDQEKNNISQILAPIVTK